MKARKKTIKTQPIYIVISILFLIFSLFLLSPLYFMIVNSFKRVDDFLEGSNWAFPKNFTFQNYIDVFSELKAGKNSFYSMIINSALFTFCAVFINLLSCTAIAYVLSKFRFYGRNILVAIAVGAIAIPDLGSTSTIYKLFLDMKIMDSWFTLIRYISPFGIGFLIIFSAFNSISKEYSEAARIDGASEWKIFLKIMIPMASGAMATIAVVSAINCWNDYYTPYMYMPSIKMLSTGLQEMSMNVSQLKRPLLYAGMVISVTPLLVVFIAARNTIIENVAAGGLKG